MSAGAPGDAAVAAIAANLAATRARLAKACAAAGRPESAVELLAVSKSHGEAAVRAAFAAGQRAFGENRVQELVAKDATTADLAALRWHLVGSLQTNKVRDLLSIARLALVHSLDRAPLADALQRELARRGKRLAVLLQVDATGEPTKHGCAVEDVPALLLHVRDRCPALDVRGLMAMGPLHGEPAATFARIAALRASLQRELGVPLPVLSLGMTGDLEQAVAAGSTLVRLGTAVFGARPAREGKA